MKTKTKKRAGRSVGRSARREEEERAVGDEDLPRYGPKEALELGLPPCAGFIEDVVRPTDTPHTFLRIEVTGAARGLRRGSIVDVAKGGRMLVLATRCILHDRRILTCAVDPERQFLATFQARLIPGSTPSFHEWAINLHLRPRDRRTKQPLETLSPHQFAEIGCLRPEDGSKPSVGEDERIVFHLTPEDRTRLEKIAAQSDVDAETWLRSVVLSAIAIDESHWREIEDRKRLVAEVDRTRFGRMSTHLRDLPERVVDLLAEALADARYTGLTEGFKKGRHR